MTPKDETPHRHRYQVLPVWNADRSGIDSWWWCTEHPAGEWVRIEDDPVADYCIPGWSITYPPLQVTVDHED